ncbi:TetR/AcrR family transcriptional regulator [Mycolicibacterium iranicum]|uniref:TetR family transcriptional regulator n=1 Tax=Mycolicibacterium iranicum TaxID=912594 RepID=A0A178LR08_MYCIR|nr:TetR/AcrR family transcriptional regulator [Mycolicibacterium iranicum]OAN33578.1 TetR family transcriptional regulator [Mycolicibacterium iranicum]
MSLTHSSTARDRIVITAYELFTHRGINAVGVDEVVEKAGVAKTTLYRHFPSKEDLVLAFLDRREQLWTSEVIDSRPRERTDDPAEQLLAIFDVLDEWFHDRSDYEACSFVKVLLEMGRTGRIGEACIEHLDRVRNILTSRAEAAGLRDPHSFAWSFNVLIKGSIVCAAEGDPDSARRAKPLAGFLIDQHRGPR